MFLLFFPASLVDTFDHSFTHSIMTNQELAKGETIDDFRGVLTRIRDVMILATTY